MVLNRNMNRRFSAYDIFGLLNVMIQIIPIRAQGSCLQTNGSRLPFFQGYIGDAGRPERRIHHQNQAIIPSYKFNCCGNITEWGVDLNPDIDGMYQTFDFILQVWRPSPTTNQLHKCYSLVNDHKITSTIINSTGRVAKVTSLPQDQLQFQPGDVLGFYVESYGSGSNSDNGVVLLSNDSHSSELVWFARVDTTTQTSQSVSCPYPVGTNGVLYSSTHAAPVISISVMPITCFPNYFLIGSIPSTSLPNPIRMTGLAPGNESPAMSTTSINYLVLGASVSVIALVAVVTVFTAVLVAAVITSKYRKQSNSTSAEQASDSGSGLYDSPAINTVHSISIQLKSNMAYATYSKTQSNPTSTEQASDSELYNSPALNTAHSIQLKSNVAYAAHSKTLS